MGSNTTFGFPVPRKLALSSCWVLFSAVGVAGAGGVQSRVPKARGELLGRCGGMLHRKNLKYRVFGIAFSALRDLISSNF